MRRYGSLACVVLVVILAFACAEKVTEPRNNPTEQTGGPQRIICEGSDCCILHPGSCGPGDDDDENGPAVQVNCTPNPVVRADTITCEARVTPASMHYVLVRWLSTGEDGETWQLVLDQPRSAGDPSVWAGPAILSTEVTVFISVEDDEGNTTQLSANTSYTVEERDWELTISQRPRFEEVGEPTLRYPPRSIGGSFRDVFGSMDLWSDTVTMSEIAGAEVGPNTPWWYFLDPFPPTDPIVWVNVGLNPGDPFYKAQDGRKGHCSGFDLDTIRTHVLEHEGAVPGRYSHYDVWVQELPSHNLGTDIEKLHAHAFDMSRIQFHELGKQTRVAWQMYMNAKHAVVDSMDSVHLTCTLNQP